jgi:hypothetical protein
MTALAAVRSAMRPLEHLHRDWSLSLRGAERRGNPPLGEPPLVRRGIAASLRSSQWQMLAGVF